METRRWRKPRSPEPPLISPVIPKPISVVTGVTMSLKASRAAPRHPSAALSPGVATRFAEISGHVRLRRLGPISLLSRTPDTNGSTRRTDQVSAPVLDKGPPKWPATFMSISTTAPTATTPPPSPSSSLRINTPCNTKIQAAPASNACREADRGPPGAELAVELSGQRFNLPRAGTRATRALTCGHRRRRPEPRCPTREGRRSRHRRSLRGAPRCLTNGPTDHGPA